MENKEAELRFEHFFWELRFSTFTSDQTERTQNLPEAPYRWVDNGPLFNDEFWNTILSHAQKIQIESYLGSLRNS